MAADEQVKKELEQSYIELYRCMIEKDLVSLSGILDDSFVLVHMTADLLGGRSGGERERRLM